MNKFFIIVSSFILIGCGATGPQGIPGAQGSIGPTGPVSATVAANQTPTQAIVSNYNEYLVSLGNDPLTPGLKCNLYTISSMPLNPCLLSTSITGCTVITSLYSFVGSWTYTGSFNQLNQSGVSGFNLLPVNIQDNYPNNFAVVCTGYVVNTDYNYHEFDVSSDDGSLVYVNGSIMLNDDGLHSLQTVKTSKYLEAEVYSFQLNYFQASGNVGLILNKDGTVLSSESFYH